MTLNVLVQGTLTLVQPILGLIGAAVSLVNMEILYFDQSPIKFRKWFANKDEPWHEKPDGEWLKKEKYRKEDDKDIHVKPRLVAEVMEERRKRGYTAEELPTEEETEKARKIIADLKIDTEDLTKE